MKTLWLVTLAAVAVICIVAAWWWMQPVPRQYVTAPVKKGNVARFVITTGNVNPVVTVQVGTYVSGPVQAIYCDYNTKVKAGQLCAKIDPKPFQVALNQAKANLASSEAQLDKDRAGFLYAKSNFDRDRVLLKRGIVSQETLDSDKSAYDQAQAQVKLDQATILQRRAALEGAQVNLDYTKIVSPVDGTVVSRNVDVGQTVAASFQTPTLFLIAQDLTKMQVDTNVSESDIGGVHVGQLATFTVDAYPDKTFEGQVTQVRKAPISVQNVVTYDAVISVANPKLLLFPGMTANVRIITAERKNVVVVPIQALQFMPNEISPNQSPEPPQTTRVWMLRNGRPFAVPVTLGLRGATAVEVIGGSLKAGDAVIIGEVSGARQQSSVHGSLFPFGRR